MTTLAVVLKDEIRRLARKEIRIQTGKQARAVAQYRREIARLKRKQREHEKQIDLLSAQIRKGGASSEEAPSHDNERRFSARSVKAQRRRTGLSAADYAKLIGVTPLTIYNWENNKSRPRNGQFQSLIALRGIGKREAQAKIASLSGGGKRRGRKPK